LKDLHDKESTNRPAINALNYCSPLPPRIVRKNYERRREIGTVANGLGLALGVFLLLATLQPSDDGFALLALMFINLCVLVVQTGISVFGIATGFAEDLTAFEARKMWLLRILCFLAFAVAVTNFVLAIIFFGHSSR
jgi:hypothetical protein